MNRSYLLGDNLSSCGMSCPPSWLPAGKSAKIVMKAPQVGVFEEAHRRHTGDYEGRASIYRIIMKWDKSWCRNTVSYFLPHFKHYTRYHTKMEFLMRFAFCNNVCCNVKIRDFSF